MNMYLIYFNRICLAQMKKDIFDVLLSTIPARHKVSGVNERYSREAEIHFT